MAYSPLDAYNQYLHEMERRMAMQSQAMNIFSNPKDLQNAYPTKPKDELDRNSQLLLLEDVK